MKRLAAVLMLVVLFFVASTAGAHSGRTDDNGGHYDRDTGKYHYHHGYPAHQHVNGECRYNHDDKTGQNSGTSGGGGKTGSKTDTTPKEEEDKKKSFPWLWVILGIGGAVYCVYCWVEAKREKAAQAAIFEKEKKAFAEKYSGKSLTREAGVPFPYAGDDSIDIYVSYNSRTGKYHSKFCRYASYGVKKSLADVPAWAQPCSICRPGRCPQWLIDYKRLKKDAQKYGVDLLP